MKSILSVILGLGFSKVALASCPNITGTYLPGEKIFVGFEQTNCTSLKKNLGPLAEDGTIRGGFSTDFKLDGTPVCNGANACTSARAEPNAIEFTLNFNGSVKTDEHGLCGHRGYELSNDVAGNLVVKFPVFGCADGYEGFVVKTYPRY